MLKETVQINILGEKINNKGMLLLADTVLNPNNKLKQINFQQLVNGNICYEMFSDNTQFYMNPTEALRVSHYVNDGDAVATVLSSGDFHLDAIYGGAKNLLTFDISRLQYPISLLKTQSIKVLSYEEFFSFFSDVCSKNYLSPEMYKLIASRSKNSLLFSFWDKFMQERISEKKRLMNDPNYRFLSDAKELLEQGVQLDEILLLIKSLIGKDGTTAIKSFNDIYYNKLMRDTDKTFKPLKTMSSLSGEGGRKTQGSYLESEKSFNTVKERISAVNINFLRTDIAKLKLNLLRTGYINGDFNGFDLIYLSNIPEFLNGITFAEIVRNQMMPLLKDTGSIIYCCQGIDEYVLKRKDISDFEKARTSCLSESDISLILNNIMEINDTEAYFILNQLYDLSFDISEKYCEVNGNGKNDIYVKIMKK